MAPIEGDIVSVNNVMRVAARRTAELGCVVSLAAAMLTVASPIHAEEASTACITMEALDTLWFGDSPDPTPWPEQLWEVPDSWLSFYLPIVEYRSVPVETRRGSFVWPVGPDGRPDFMAYLATGEIYVGVANPCQDPSTVVQKNLPFLVQQGGGVGFIVLGEDQFNCTDESICDFYYAGKRYNLRSKATIKALSCANRPYAASLPARPNGEATRPWAEKGALCMPVPNRPGTYEIFFEARKKGTAPKDTYAYQCRYFLDMYHCGWYVDGDDGSGTSGRKFTYKREIVVTDDAVVLRKP